MPVRFASIPVRAVAILIAVAASAVPARAQSLAGSRASLDLQNRVAFDHDFSFLRTSGQVKKFVSSGFLVPIRPNGDFELHQVSYPYARPAVQTFVERLASQYRRACGERLVVTSLTRPASEQPSNASDRSVHPTGMALDLRLATNPSCRNWLERVLLDLERARVIEATRERRPAHYHVAVFPNAYERYLRGRGSDDPTTVTAEAAPVPVAPAPVRYRVRSGDSLWTIARKHGTTVARLKNENALASSRILPGQLLELPTSD